MHLVEGLDLLEEFAHMRSELGEEVPVLQCVAVHVLNRKILLKMHIVWPTYR
jgi:hypothetical protein